MKRAFGILAAAGLALAACGTTTTTQSDGASAGQTDTEVRAAVGAFITACVRNPQPKGSEASLKTLGFVQTGATSIGATYSSSFASATLEKNGLCRVTPTSGTSAQVKTLLNATLPNAQVGAQKQNEETWLLGSGAVVLISPADGTMTRTATSAIRS